MAREVSYEQVKPDSTSYLSESCEETVLRSPTTSISPTGLANLE